MHLNFFYTMVQKSQKMTKNSKQGGPALKLFPLFFVCNLFPFFAIAVLVFPTVAGLTPKTACQKRASSEKKKCAGLIGCFITSCNKDGTFPSKQCSSSSGYCHCEDENGTKILGTDHRPYSSAEDVDCDSKRTEGEFSCYRFSSCDSLALLFIGLSIFPTCGTSLDCSFTH